MPNAKSVFSRRTALAFGLTFAALPVALHASGDTTPQAVIGALLNAMQANQGDRIRELFAEDARQAYGTSPAKSGDTLRAWLETDVIQPQGRVDNARLAVTGNEVIVTGRYKNANGYESASDFLFEVRQGKITSWQMRY